LAGEATRAVTLLPIDLAAHVRQRQRRRLRAGALVTACVGVAAVAVGYWPTNAHPVQVTTASATTASAPAEPPVAASDATGVWATIAAEVRSTVREFTDPPLTAVGVATTLKDAEEALGTPAPAGEPSSTPVYLVIATGQFTCSSECVNVNGQPSHGTVLGVLIDQAALYITSVSLTTKPIDISRLGTIHQLDLSPAPTLKVPTGPACTDSDLQARQIKTMPTPAVVTRTLVLQPKPNLEQLSPPDTAAKITASQAWAAMISNGVELPVATGPVQILLGDLYSQTPATIQNYTWPPTSNNPDTNTQPIYTHTLVWAIYSQHQPEVTSGGPYIAPSPGMTTTTVPHPPCFFESAVTYIDATTGQGLSSENFPPNQ
jgi:hypothetical protein